jgi:hypothetical protein
VRAALESWGATPWRSRVLVFLSPWSALKPFLKQDSNIVGSHKPRQRVPWKKTKTTIDSTGAVFLLGDGELSPRPLTLNWNTGRGQQNRWDLNVLPRMPSPSGSNFSLDGANLQLQLQTSLLSHHQMAAKPFSTIPQHLIHWQDGVERPQSSPSI